VDPVPAVVVDRLVKRYGERTAVDELSFTVAPGELLALLGPNGAGKTTTVETLEGYRTPDGGRVRVLGLDPRRDGAALRRRIGLMLQRGGLYPLLRPLELLRLYATYYPDPERPEALLERVGLDDPVVRRTAYRRLSGGEQQRLSLAVALVGRPELVFLDEPTAGLDPAARLRTGALIRELRSAGVTVLLTTHDLAEAERVADRVAIIDGGRLVALGTPAELLRGGDRLRFRAAPGLPVEALAAELRRAVGTGAGEPAELAVSEPAPGEYTVAARVTAELIAALAAVLRDRDVLLAELSTGQGSLEALFLRLTGERSAAEPPAERPAAEG